METQLWLLYDGRYRTNEDRAMVYEVCNSLREAEENASDYGTDTVIVEVTVKGKIFHNPKILN
jgi:hypothetical protein